jgi:hypothetical protein
VGEPAMIVDDERDGVWRWALTGLAYLVGIMLTAVFVVGLAAVVVMQRCRNGETRGT